MTNLVPGAYRGVAVAEVDVGLDATSLAGHFVGREAYRRSRWIVVSNGDDHAVIGVRRADEQALFAPITGIDMVAGADETRLVARPDIDTGVPSQLARAAQDPAAAGARCVVVQGRYGHVSFIVDPDPVRIRVVEVVPPVPAKLAEQAQRVLDVAEDLPPVVLVEERFALGDVAPADGAILLPCRGAEIDLPGRDVSYLDQHPEHRRWTLLGCTRSEQIHAWFYGGLPDASVDLCPRRLRVTGTGPVLTKCCLLESDISVEPGRAVVPWGASLGQIGDALRHLAGQVASGWRPA
ncbi:MAG: hypothetical protein M3063_13485 [Actinomycetota bacterium]|nr:hypothetical protein [Actinomycetota bacterium]